MGYAEDRKMLTGEYVTEAIASKLAGSPVRRMVTELPVVPTVAVLQSDLLDLREALMADGPLPPLVRLGIAFKLSLMAGERR